MLTGPSSQMRTIVHYGEATLGAGTILSPKLACPTPTLSYKYFFGTPYRTRVETIIDKSLLLNYAHLSTLTLVSCQYPKDEQEVTSWTAPSVPLPLCAPIKSPLCFSPLFISLISVLGQVTECSSFLSVDV